MKKAIKILAAFGIFIILVSFIILKSPLVKYPTSLLLSAIFKSNVTIKSCSFSFKEGILIKDTEIKNKSGFYGEVKQGYIKPNFYPLLKGNLVFDISLKSVRFSSANSKVINGIAELFGIEPIELFKFNAVDGMIFIKGDELIVKDLKAQGDDITFFANGTTKAAKSITYSLKLILSENITSKIPEDVRSIFFKKQDRYSEVELYLNGDLKKPSINFSTPLFKLNIK